MRIVIETPLGDEEDEIIIRCKELDSSLMELIYALKAGRTRLTGYTADGIVKLSPKEVFYFESVDNKVFAYCKNSVFEIKQKLYEIEESYHDSDFLRISKSVIVNVSKIVKVSPGFNGKFEAHLKNGEKTVISRQYVPDLKKKLGLTEGGK